MLSEYEIYQSNSSSSNDVNVRVNGERINLLINTGASLCANKYECLVVVCISRMTK